MTPHDDLTTAETSLSLATAWQWHEHCPNHGTLGTSLHSVRDGCDNDFHAGHLLSFVKSGLTCQTLTAGLDPCFERGTATADLLHLARHYAAHDRKVELQAINQYQLQGRDWKIDCLLVKSMILAEESPSASSSAFSPGSELH